MFRFIVAALLAGGLLGGGVGGGFGPLSGAAGAAAIIIDHNSPRSHAELMALGQPAIVYAKQKLHIAYGHTSHGSQLITGMNGLDAFMRSKYATPLGLYAWNEGGTGGALDIDDTFVSGDLGAPDRSTWASRTRTYLNTPANADVNVVIWSWCGQASTATAADINLYLSLMSQLEADYPAVKFVYMTGHLDGGGAAGNLNLRNNQIRDYCRANDKVLYDFADIESYDPDRLTNFMALKCTDNCDYDLNGDGTRERNWATDWQTAHPGQWYSCSPAHTQPLNGNLKAYAAWALWTALAPLPPPTVTVSGALSRSWVYQNTPATTGDRHLVYLTLTVSGTTNYSVAVAEDAGDIGDVRIEGTGNPLVWVIRGSPRQPGGAAGTGQVKLNVTVTDVPSGASGTAAVNLVSRQLGDLDGLGGVNGQDRLLMNKRLNGLVPDSAEHDLDCLGGCSGQDKLILNKILNGLPIP